MPAFIHHNKLDINPEKSYEEIAIGQKQGCKNLIQSILYVKNTPVIFNKTKIIRNKFILFRKNINKMYYF